MDTAAHNLANASTEPFWPLRPDGTQGAPGSLDLAGEVVGTMQATVIYGANLRVIHAEDEMRASVVNILA
jgi:flagellar basal body rod protein FlgC